MRTIYFDNAATTMPRPAVAAYLQESAFTKCYANPSSLHEFGLDAEREMKRAALIIAGIINCEPSELFFTSGGTMSNNAAILGVSGLTRKASFICSSVEHPSVSACFAELASRGFSAERIKPYGVERELREKITGETALVSIMHVNNESGVINYIEAIGRLVKEINPNALFHVDAVQGYCKHLIDVKKSKIDLLSVSSHKIHGTKGCGALYVRKGVRLKPIIYGGGQQGGIFPGTENSFGVFAFGRASEIAAAEALETAERVRKIKEYIVGAVSDFAAVNFAGLETSPYILSLALPGMKSETVLHALSQRGVFVSSGSACSSRVKKNPVLTAYELPPKILDSTIRVSFSSLSTLEEAEIFVRELRSVAASL